MLTGQRLEQELADLRAAVVCAKEAKQAQEEHYLRQIIKVGFDRQCLTNLERFSRQCRHILLINQPETHPVMLPK